MNIHKAANLNLASGLGRLDQRVGGTCILLKGLTLNPDITSRSPWLI